MKPVPHAKCPDCELWLRVTVHGDQAYWCPVCGHPPMCRCLTQPRFCQCQKAKGWKDADSMADR